jgi:mRNA interferase MazF
MTYKPFSIVVVPFPFTDKIGQKRRPALVLSRISQQKATAHVTLAMITSAKNSQWINDHQLQDLVAAGLTSPSIVRQKIFTIDTRLILKSSGKLASQDETAVKKHLAEHFDF